MNEIVYTPDEKCIVCGKSVPEGRQVCLICMDWYENPKKIIFENVKKTRKGTATED